MALQIAIQTGILHVTEALLSSRVLSPEAVIARDRIGFQFAASINCMRSVEIYIEHGADVNEPAIGHWNGGNRTYVGC